MLGCQIVCISELVQSTRLTGGEHVSWMVGSSRYDVSCVALSVLEAKIEQPWVSQHSFRKLLLVHNPQPWGKALLVRLNAFLGCGSSFVDAPILSSGVSTASFFWEMIETVFHLAREHA